MYSSNLAILTQDDVRENNDISRNLKYCIFYLFVASVFIQVWVIVATSNNTPTIIITAILSGFAVAIIIWKQVFGRILPPQRVAQVENATTTPETTQSPPRHDNGLDSNTIKRLETFQYQGIHNQNDDNVIKINPSNSIILSESDNHGYHQDDDSPSHTTMCIICINDYKPDETIMRLPCKHNYHPTCILEWFIKHNTCPICKVKVEFKDGDAIKNTTDIV